MLVWVNSTILGHLGELGLVWAEGIASQDVPGSSDDVSTQHMKSSEDDQLAITIK